MNSNEVWNFVSAQLEDVSENKFGWDFSNCFVNPPKKISISDPNGFAYESWLVFDSDETGNEKGYVICFNAHDGSFDLVTNGISVSTCYNFLDAINGI